MDNRPIGFFDSGLGGLTSIPYLRKHLPNEKVIYFGDTARTPYGSKTPKTITNFACQIADFLVEQGARIVLCYDLGEGGRDVLFERNIAVLAGLMGKADDAVIALLENRLRYADAAEASGGCSCGCGGHHDGGSCDCGETCGDDCGSCTGDHSGSG